MLIAPLLFITSTMAPPVPAPAAPAAQQRPTVAPAAMNAPVHRLGFGGSLAVSNVGVAGSTRYWFSKHVGVSLYAGWYRPRVYGYSGYSSPVTRPSTISATPSLMVTLGSTDPGRPVSLRPFVGVGASYMHATNALVPVAGVTQTSSAWSPMALGGSEFFFRDHPSLSLSAEATYYRVPSTFLNARSVGGLNFQVGVHFYLK